LKNIFDDVRINLLEIKTKTKLGVEKAM